jgi:hypothetical protein
MERIHYTKIASYLYHNDKDNPLRTVINNALENYSSHPKTIVDFKFTPAARKRHASGVFGNVAQR